MKSFQPYSYIVIEGNIGAGKTSLAKILSNKFNASLVLEQFADNTFLPQFYEQPERFAFPLEMSFLAERYQQIVKHLEAAEFSKNLLIGDYIFEKSFLFAQVTLKGPELELFNTFYKLIQPSLKKPDLIVYLNKTTDSLLQNINKRGRDFEKEIGADYLEKISKTYLNYFKTINNQRVIILESDHIDFVNNPVHLRFVLDLFSNEQPPKLQHITM